MGGQREGDYERDCMGGGRGKYDQDMLYNFFKELIKYYMVKIYRKKFQPVKQVS